MRFSGAFLVFAAATSVLSVPRAASACGGCFVPPPDAPQKSTVVTAHRMALSISPEQTILWDQIRYAGAPDEFAWVLPVKQGARVEVATDAWFDVLDAATSPVVYPPDLSCPTGQLGCSVSGPSAGVAVSAPLWVGFGCGAGSDEGALQNL